MGLVDDVAVDIEDDFLGAIEGVGTLALDDTLMAERVEESDGSLAFDVLGIEEVALGPLVVGYLDLNLDVFLLAELA